MAIPDESSPSPAVACAAGGFKGVFLTGVLAAFESLGLRAQAYGGTSSSVIPAGYAAIGEVQNLGIAYWMEGLEVLSRPGNGMSEMVLAGIGEYTPQLCEQLFLPGAPDFYIAANEVVTPSGIAQTQGPGARRLGRRLLLETARGDRSWVDAHLELKIFASHFNGEREVDGDILSLDPDSFAEVAYASSRMLHAWDVPAWVAGRAFVDAAYTCNCPAMELADLGYHQVIAILNQPGPPFRDLFGLELLADYWRGAEIIFVQPDFDPEDVGVYFTQADPYGLHEVYRHGLERGLEFIERWKS